MSINYEDIKSEWLITPQNSSVEFTILADAVKVMKTSQRTGNPYPSYEFKVESEGNKYKWSTLLNTYRQMVDEAGKPESLVGCRFKSCHASVDGKDSYAVVYLGGAVAPSPSGGGEPK